MAVYILERQEKREQFMADLTEPENPYALALKHCLEKTYELLRACDQHELKTPLLFECGGKREDAELELVFRRLCAGLSDSMSPDRKGEIALLR